MELKEFLVELVFAIVLTLLPPLVAMAFHYLRGAAKAKWAEFEANKPKLADYIEQAVALGVNAAEQVGLKDAAVEKLTYALSAAERYLSAHGIDDVDLNLLVDAIEAELALGYNKDKLIQS